MMKNKSFKSGILFPILFILTSCSQETMLFYPEKLPGSFQFSFNGSYKEYFFKVDEHTELNGLLFKSNESKGLVFYLHGNAGSLRSWGNVAEFYVRCNYDVFIIDYRGFGKSQGRISGEKQMYRDMQIVYDSIKNLYPENKIIIIGYSIGTGLAVHLASTNNPRLLILNAPYYNMTDLVHSYIKILPSFLIRYKFKTNESITKVKSPVIIFHGDSDETIYTGSSVKLSKLFKPADKLHILKGQQHNGIDDNPTYQMIMKDYLK
jgi:uncharacterized protein